MSFTRRALAPVPVESRGTLAGPWDGSALQVPAPTSSGRMSTAGQKVDDASALGVIALFAGVRIIADAVATTPLRAVTIADDGTRVPVFPSPPQVTNPFMGVSLIEGISQIVTSLILRGNAYLYVTTRGKDFKPTNLRILHPDQVDVGWGNDGFRVYKINSKRVDSFDLIHLTGYMLPNALTGASIIEYCRNAIGIDIALEDVAGQFFSNGIMASGIISVDAPLTDDQSRQAAEMFSSRHAGSNRAFKPVVLGGGSKFQSISLTLEDAQFLQSRQWGTQQMVTMLGIPPHLLGIVDKTTSWGTGIESQGRAFVDYTLRTFYVRIGNMFTSLLPKGVFSDFITDALTRADTATRFSNYALALGANNGIGWMSPNEVRTLEGLPKIPGGDTYYVAATSISSTATPSIPGSGAIIPPTDPSTGASNADPSN